MPETSSTFRKSCRQSLWISNSEEFPVVLCIEPWASEIQLLTGNDYQVIFEGPEGEFPAVEWGKSRDHTLRLVRLCRSSFPWWYRTAVVRHPSTQNAQALTRKQV